MAAPTLDTFTRAYLACALWSSTACGSEGERAATEAGESYDASFERENYEIDDIAPEALASAVEDCRAFRETAGDLLNEWSDEQAGHDFWLTRNRHGAGFWDRGLPHGRELSDLAHPYGTADLYVGDDGQIYGF